MFWAGGHGNRAHRWIVEYERGPIPDGMVVDHLCRNRGCVNVDHLEVVTQQVNARRRSDATHGPIERGCVHGHPAIDMILYVYDGVPKRHCRTCDRERAESRRRAKGASIQRTRDASSCLHGHPWPEYLRVGANGKSFCGECKRLHSQRRAAARKVARATTRQLLC
jgi:hypothetical protein